MLSALFFTGYTIHHSHIITNQLRVDGCCLESFARLVIRYLKSMSTTSDSETTYGFTKDYCWSILKEVVKHRRDESSYIDVYSALPASLHVNLLKLQYSETKKGLTRSKAMEQLKIHSCVGEDCGGLELLELLEKLIDAFPSQNDEDTVNDWLKEAVKRCSKHGETYVLSRSNSIDITKLYNPFIYFKTIPRCQQFNNFLLKLGSKVLTMFSIKKIQELLIYMREQDIPITIFEGFTLTYNYENIQGLVDIIRYIIVPSPEFHSIINFQKTVQDYLNFSFGWHIIHVKLLEKFNLIKFVNEPREKDLDICNLRQLHKQSPYTYNRDRRVINVGDPNNISLFKGEPAKIDLNEFKYSWPDSFRTDGNLKVFYYLHKKGRSVNISIKDIFRVIRSTHKYNEEIVTLLEFLIKSADPKDSNVFSYYFDCIVGEASLIRSHVNSLPYQERNKFIHGLFSEYMTRTVETYTKSTLFKYFETYPFNREYRQVYGEPMFEVLSSGKHNKLSEELINHFDVDLCSVNTNGESLLSTICLANNAKKLLKRADGEKLKYALSLTDEGVRAKVRAIIEEESEDEEDEESEDEESEDEESEDEEEMNEESEEEMNEE